jgi:hypothetical protein
VIECECFENERFNTDTRTWIPNDRDCCHFSDASGLIERRRNAFTRPSRRWAWVSAWSVRAVAADVAGPVAASTSLVNVGAGAGSKSDGWVYTREYGQLQQEHWDLRASDRFRRRCWVRRCQIVDTSPWTQVS